MLGLCIFTAKGPGFQSLVGNEDSVSHMALSKKKKRQIHLKNKTVPHYTSKVDFDTTSAAVAAAAAAKSLQSCRLCATPETASHQAPLSLGFSRQEYWSGLPFPSPTHESEK